MTGPHADDPTGCATPLESALLMDYWLGALPPADEEAVEAHLMSCDACGDRLRRVIALSDGLRALARSGSLQVVVSDRSGLKPGEKVTPKTVQIMEYQETSQE